MKLKKPIYPSAFTLLETVIAIGVLAVLLTGFMIVFAPAAQGIRKAISVQEADRLIATIDQELTNHRTGSAFKTGFEKAYDFIKESGAATPGSALLVYQYRGDINGATRPDGSVPPLAELRDKVVGKDYVVSSMVRRRDDPLLRDDIAALEGGLYLVKCTQLIFDSGATGGLVLGLPGEIKDPKGQSGGSTADTYPEAVIAYTADLYPLSGRSWDYLSSPAFSKAYEKARIPVFSRNLAVRR